MFTSRLFNQRQKTSEGFFCVRDPRRGTHVFCVITVLQTAVWTFMAAYELSKTGNMVNQYDTPEKRRHVSSFKDKDGYDIDREDVGKMVTRSRIEQTICTLFMLALLSLAFSAGGVLIGGEDTQVKSRLRPFMVMVLVVSIYGSVANILDCQTYGFHLENNIQIIMWIIFIVLTLNGFRCVHEYYKSIGRPDGESQVDINGNRVFTVSEQMQMELAMAPPSYEEIMANDLVDPPDYDTYMRQLREQRQTERAHGSGTTLTVHYDRELGEVHVPPLQPAPPPYASISRLSPEPESRTAVPSGDRS